MKARTIAQDVLENTLISLLENHKLKERLQRFEYDYVETWCTNVKLYEKEVSIGKTAGKKSWPFIPLE